jgi:hypothetical protein
MIVEFLSVVTESQPGLAYMFLDVQEDKAKAATESSVCHLLLS